MITLELREATEIVVVDAANLSQYLGDMVYGLHGRGWKLIAVLEEEKLEHYNETQPNPAFKQDQGEYGSNVRLHQLQKVQKLKTHKYVLGKTRDEVLEEMGQKVSSATSRASQLEHDKQLVEKTLTELETKLDKLAKEKTSVERDLECTYKELNEKRKAFQDMEKDIAKVRTAVGADRMKEIVGR